MPRYVVHKTFHRSVIVAGRRRSRQRDSPYVPGPLLRMLGDERTVQRVFCCSEVDTQQSTLDYKHGRRCALAENLPCPHSILSGDPTHTPFAT